MMPPAARCSGDDDLLALLARADLPAAFERRRLVLAPGVGGTTGPVPWAGALVLVEQGRLEVDCAARGRHVFGPGEVLVLGSLPLVSVHNPGQTALRLTIVHRRGERLPGELARVLRQLRG
jgi:hypothetical protein